MGKFANLFKMPALGDASAQAAPTPEMLAAAVRARKIREWADQEITKEFQEWLRGEVMLLVDAIAQDRPLSSGIVKGVRHVENHVAQMIALAREVSDGPEDR